MMVPQEHYPFDTARELQYVTKNPPPGMKEEYRSGKIRIMSEDYTTLYMFMDDVAIGKLHLVNAGNDIKKLIGTRGWQVMDVFISEKFRNQRLGLVLYNFVLHHRKHAFTSAAAMTPASRRVYGSFLKDPKVDVYALVAPEDQPASDTFGPDDGYRGHRSHPLQADPKDLIRHELHLGPDGITTGDADLDSDSMFVMVAK